MKNQLGFKELDLRIKEIGQRFIREAKCQSWKYEINPVKEAQKIGVSCGIFKKGIFEKKQHPVYFIDIALCLLCYPPELALLIAAQFAEFEDNLGYSPFGSIMMALGQIDSLFNSLIFKRSLFNEKPVLFEVIENKSLRIQKAGQLLAVAILSSPNIEEARELYHINKFNPSVKTVLDKELEKYNKEIAQKIIS